MKKIKLYKIRVYPPEQMGVPELAEHYYVLTESIQKAFKMMKKEYQTDYGLDAELEWDRIERLADNDDPEDANYLIVGVEGIR